MKRKHLLTILSADGHRIVIERKRLILRLFMYRYYVSVFSKANNGHVIYGWDTTNGRDVTTIAKSWTVEEIFKNNPYLKSELAQSL